MNEDKCCKTCKHSSPDLLLVNCRAPLPQWLSESDLDYYYLADGLLPAYGIACEMHEEDES